MLSCLHTALLASVQREYRSFRNHSVFAVYSLARLPLSSCFKCIISTQPTPVSRAVLVGSELPQQIASKCSVFLLSAWEAAQCQSSAMRKIRPEIAGSAAANYDDCAAVADRASFCFLSCPVRLRCPVRCSALRRSLSDAHSLRQLLADVCPTYGRCLHWA